MCNALFFILGNRVQSPIFLCLFSKRNASIAKSPKDIIKTSNFEENKKDGQIRPYFQAAKTKDGTEISYHSQEADNNRQRASDAGREWTATSPTGLRNLKEGKSIHVERVISELINLAMYLRLI